MSGTPPGPLTPAHERPSAVPSEEPSIGNTSFANATATASAAAAGTARGAPSVAPVPENDEESQTTFGGSWQEEAPPPVDPSLSRAADFVSPGSVHSVHLSHLKPQELRTISRMRFSTRDFEVAPASPRRNRLIRALRWYCSWAVPGMGMFVGQWAGGGIPCVSGGIPLSVGSCTACPMARLHLPTSPGSSFLTVSPHPTRTRAPCCPSHIEAWMIFAIGNITPLLAIQYPHCFGNAQPPACSQGAVDSVTYIEVCGIILGMLVLGFCADIIGRKLGSRLTASIMFVGGGLLTGCAGNDGQFLAMLLASLFIFGTGVGGEYPVSGSSAAERAEGSKATRRRRGETVLLTFSQQGWGNLSNTLTILLLLAVQGATGADVSPRQAEVTWRVQFAIGTAICAVLTGYRWRYLQESKVWKAEKHDVAEHLAHKGVHRHHSKHEYVLVLHRYWPRLLIASLGWLLSNFAFYGHKLNQALFISVISGPNASVYTRTAYALLNSGVALVGYYCAAALIDRRWYGRVRMQSVGFFWLFTLFVLCAALYDTLLDHTAVFMFLYLLSSFWNQLGPNCTTFLVASEVYPTGVRSFFNGISAAVGKVGALIAAATFTHISPQSAFYASAGAGGLGCVLTLVFLPDTTGLDLHEIDRMNRYMLAGQLGNYHGQAVNPLYLSWYERRRGYGQHFQPERDMVHKHLQRHPHIEPFTPPPSLAGRSRQSSRVGSRWIPRFSWTGTALI